jgi:hypothetical protein
MYRAQRTRNIDRDDKIFFQYQASADDKISAPSDADEWPEVANMVQSVLNNSLSTRLNKRMPMKVFTEHAETPPPALMLKNNVPVNVPLDFIKAQKLMEVEQLSKSMTEIHAQVAEKATRDRKGTVIDILCRDNKAEGLYALFKTCGDPSTSQSQPYLHTVVNLLHDIIWSSSRTSTFPATPLGRDLSCFIINSTG